MHILSRVFFYDVVTGFILLVDKANGLLVDMSGALDGQSKLWATERLSLIMVIGHLERSSASVGRFKFLYIFQVAYLSLIWTLGSLVDSSSYSPNANQYTIVSAKRSCSPGHPCNSCCRVGF